MAGLDTNLAVRWTIDTLLADDDTGDPGSILSLLGGPKVYRVVGPGSGYPYIVVGTQVVLGREGAILSGPNTHTATGTRVRTSIWDLNNYTAIDAIGARITELLDGQAYEVVDDGEVFICSWAGEIPDRTAGDENHPVRGWDIFWDIAAKAN